MRQCRVKERLVSFNTFNGTNLTLNSAMALVSTQVKTLLYLVRLKAGESSDISMFAAYTRALGNQQDVSPTFTHWRM